MISLKSSIRTKYESTTTKDAKYGVKKKEITFCESGLLFAVQQHGRIVVAKGTGRPHASRALPARVCTARVFDHVYALITRMYPGSMSHYGDT